MELFKSIDIFPFTRVIYNSPEAQKEWSPKIYDAASLHHRAEFEMVRMGYRRAATMHISPRTYDKDIEMIMQNNLVWLPIQCTKNYSGFSHKHYPANPGDPNTSVYGVLARTLEDAETFRRASRNPVDHDVIGELLGFPKCCRDFFNEVWAAGYYDPVWQAAERTKGAQKVSDTHIILKEVYPSAVHSLRYAGPRITSHLSCSFSCEESNKVGQKWIECMEKIDRKGLHNMLEILNLPWRWSVYRGIAIVTTPYFRIITNSMPTIKEYVIEYWPEPKN